MKHKELAEKIVELSGGRENFSSLTNCMTRVRINYVDESKVDLKKIEELDGVLGIREEDTTQIIVGPGHSAKVKDEIESLIGSGGENSSPEEDQPVKKKNFLKMLSSIFIPVIPAIIASGILGGIKNIITGLADEEVIKSGISETDTLTAQQVVLDSWNMLEVTSFLEILFAATFSFLAIYIGITAAREFKTDIILGGVLGAITISGELGILGLTSGEGGLFGVIIAVYIMSKIQKLLRKVIPHILDVVLTPTLTLIITAAVFLFTVMPLAGMLSNWIVDGLYALLEFSGILGGFALSALFPSLILTGLHHGLTPIHMELINSTGADPLFPVQIMSNAGMFGAGLAIYFLTKSKKVKEVAKGALPTTFLAVGEPTMYGVVLPAGFAWFTGSIGAGIGGIFIRLFDVQSSAIGAAGMSAIPLIANGDYLLYLLCYVIGGTAAFTLTFIVGKARGFN